MPFQRIAILGCGLIGGSFALALKQAGFAGEIVGWGREAALERAQQRGAIDRGVVDLAQAVADADLVYLSTPVGAILDIRVGPTRAASRSSTRVEQLQLS